MAIAGAAPAPHGFVEFCERRPGECGVTPAELADMRQAAEGSAPATAAIFPTWAVQSASAYAPASGAQAPRQLGPNTYDWSLVFASSGILPAPHSVETSARATAKPVMLDSQTWALLTRTNNAVNRAIVQRNDVDIYGVEEFWATPLEDGRQVGDCEDYVLEKRRALVAAGVPATALSIAVVQTQRGQTHAVLLVATDKGDYALDNLNPWILPWTKTEDIWRERQVEGSAASWAFAAGAATDSPVRLLLADLR